MKAPKLSSLSEHYKEKRCKLSEKYVNTDFSTVNFTDQCRATSDGADGWPSSWIFQGNRQLTEMRKQKYGGRLIS